MKRHRNDNSNVNNNYNNYNQNGQYYNQNGQYYDGQYYNQNGQYYDQNGQYYDQSQYYNNQQPYNQNNVKTEQKLFDKKTIIILGLFLVALIGAIVAYFVITHEEVPEETPIVETDEKTIGNTSLGYLVIPSDWLKFTNIENVSGIQYADKDEQYIITFDIIMDSSIDIDTYATVSVINDLRSKNVTQITENKVNLAGYSAYQIYGFHEQSQKWISLWCFKAEDNVIHYIGIEGPDFNSQYFKIPNTFKLKK